MFNAKRVKNEIVDWIREWFMKNGADCQAVVGVSGGKDSSVVAALCVEALGVDRVIGVMMPCGVQKDIDMSEKLIKHLGIQSTWINIENAVNSILSYVGEGFEFYDMREYFVTEQTRTNLPARIRMATLYAVSQSVNGRVSNNCNLSERYIGWSTHYGDDVGDFSPLSNLTCTEVIAIGYELGLPEELLIKAPSDGLCGKTDEDSFGFTYEELDKYIREGIIDDVEHQKRIELFHYKNLFKQASIPRFEYK